MSPGCRSLTQTSPCAPTFSPKERGLHASLNTILHIHAPCVPLCVGTAPPCVATRGVSLPHYIQKLHWMVREVVYFQQFLNACSVRY